MSLRDNVLIQRHAINKGQLDWLLRAIRQAALRDSLVSNFEDDAGTATEWVVNKRIRDTQEVELSGEMNLKLNAAIEQSVRELINPFYAVTIHDWEPPHILHYGAGGHYIAHVDAETLYKDEAGVDWWEKTLDRDVSAVYFLNDDYVGGELVFPDLELTIRPEAGMLVCFPSDHNYIHGVSPVTAGERYTMVTWLRVMGMPSPDAINQATLEEHRRSSPKPVGQSPRVVKGGLGSANQRL